jgi:hypothetical protein
MKILDGLAILVILSLWSFPALATPIHAAFIKEYH